MFFDAAQIGYKYISVVIIPRIWTVWVAAYVCTKERYRPSWDSSLSPPELADEPTWRHNIWIIFIVNINQSPIYVGHLLIEYLAIYAQQTYETLDQFATLVSRWTCIANGYLENPLDPLAPRPTTLDFIFFIVFFIVCL